MPNWCEGVLKVRGKKKDLLNFINNEIVRYGYPRTETNDYTLYPLDVKFDEFGDVFIEETDEKNHSWLHFNNSRRLFIEKNVEWHFWTEDEDELQVLDIKQAWRIDEDYFVDISKKYNIDFKIMAFECGMCFSQEIEVIKGELTQNKKNTYDDYNWEVYDPRLGG